MRRVVMLAMAGLIVGVLLPAVSFAGNGAMQRKRDRSCEGAAQQDRQQLRQRQRDGSCDGYPQTERARVRQRQRDCQESPAQQRQRERQGRENSRRATEAACGCTDCSCVPRDCATACGCGGGKTCDCADECCAAT